MKPHGVSEPYVNTVESSRRHGDPGDRGAESGARGAQSGARGAQSGERGAKSGEGGAQSGARGAESGARGAQSGERGAQSGARVEESGERVEESGAQGAESGERTYRRPVPPPARIRLQPRQFVRQAVEAHPGLFLGRQNGHRDRLLVHIDAELDDWASSH